jgi:predicted glycosyltransferase
MALNSTYNILMYSHDTYGLGHIRRTMAIASQLLGPRINILILTGSPIAGRFSFPDRIDFVQIPGMIKKTNDEYLPLSIKINAQHALDIRKRLPLTMPGFRKPFRMVKPDCWSMYALEPFVAAIKRLLADKNLRQQMGFAARSYVREFHDLNKNYQELELSLSLIARR